MIQLPLDHVAVAVTSLRESIALFESLTGANATPVETLDSHGVQVAFVDALELLEPLGPDTPVGRFLSRHGPGLHHVAYCTIEIERELARLVAAGFEAIDPRPRPGARGHQVVFLHPRTAGNVMVELVQPGVPFVSP